MISFTTTALTPAEDADLRSWLSKSGAHIMHKVIVSKMDKHIVESITPLLETADYPAKLDAVNEQIRKAHRYQIFLEVFQELIGQAGDAPFEINKLIQ